jgi:alkylation response protein AidB-like acyl-CoA dehydrogenase
MDFSTSEEQEAVRAVARRFLNQQLSHQGLSRDEELRRGIDPDVWQRICDLGWPSLLLPMERGGSGGTLVDAGLLLREVGRTGAATPLLQQTAVVDVLLRLGDSPERALVMSGIVKGETVALASPQGERAMPCLVPGRAAAHVEGDPLIVEWGWYATKLVVPCLNEVAQEVQMVLLDRSDDGIVVERCEVIDNQPVARVTFDVTEDAAAPVLLGTISTDRWHAERRRLALLRSHELTGGLQRMVELATEHVGVREQFGRPIGSFQSVQHGLADAAIAVRSAEMSTLLATWWAATGRPSARAEHMAIYATSVAADRVASITAQYMGGIGFTVESPFERLFRRAKGQKLRLGRPYEHLVALGRLGLADCEPSGSGLAKRVRRST